MANQKSISINKILCIIFAAIIWSFSLVGYTSQISIFMILTWFSLIPYVILVRNENYINGFLYSLIFGFIVYVLNLWWITIVIYKVGVTGIFNLTGNLFYRFLSFFAGIIITIIISLYHGLFYSLAFIIVRIISKKNIFNYYLIFPLIILVFDCFYPKLFYDQIGYSQFSFFYLIQCVDIFGVPFISLIVLYCNSGLALLIELIINNQKKNIGILFLSIVAIIVLLLNLYGVIRVNQLKTMISKSKNAAIGIVQGNNSSYEYFNIKNFDKIIFKYNNLSKKILDKNPDVIVWPEAAIPIIKNINVEYYYDVKKFKDIPLFTGIKLKESVNNVKIYNSAILISGKGKKIDYYHKVKLVPFGEKFLIEIFGLRGFDKGTNFKLFKIGDIKFSPGICYEGIIPHFMIETLNSYEQEANLLINITNDSWYGRTIEKKMHFVMTSMRAIEQRKSLIRSTTTGHTGVINPYGKVFYISKFNVEESVVCDVPLLEIKTIYRKCGWLFTRIIVCLIFILFTIILLKDKKKLIK